MTYFSWRPQLLTVLCILNNFSWLLILADAQVFPPTFPPAYDYIFRAKFDALVWQGVIERLAQKGKWRVSLLLRYLLLHSGCLCPTSLGQAHVTFKIQNRNIYCSLVQMSLFLSLEKYFRGKIISEIHFSKGYSELEIPVVSCCCLCCNYSAI